MADSRNQDEGDIILNLVQDTVVPYRDAPEIFRLLELSGPGWAGIFGQGIDLATDALLVGPGYGLQVTFRGGLQLDPVAHRCLSPRGPLG